MASIFSLKRELKGKSRGKLSIEFVAVVGFLLVMYIIMSKVGIFLHTPAAKSIIASYGTLTPLIYALLFVGTLVIAPLPGLPVMMIGIGVFGFLNAMIYSYFLALIGAAINFWIARRYGRPVVRWLVGKRGLRKIDKHTDEFSSEMLVLTRLFDGLLFEWVSYAAGLTNISFTRYFVITAVCSLPYILLTILLSWKFTDLGELFLMVCIVNSVTMSFPFLYFIIKKIFIKKAKT